MHQTTGISLSAIDVPAELGVARPTVLDGRAELLLYPAGPEAARQGVSCVARILTARCGLADQVEIRQANALALPFEDGAFDHVWSYAVTMNIADKRRLGREVARVLKPGGRFSCNEIELGTGGAPMFPLPWATDEARVSL